LIPATIEASYFKFGTPLGSAEYLAKKQLLGPKFTAVWARGASRKFGTPYLSLQPLKLVISNLVHTWVWEYLTKKQLLPPKLAGVRTWGATQKFWDLLLISATVEARKFKFGT